MITAPLPWSAPPLSVRRLAVALGTALAALWLLELVPAAAVLTGPVNLLTATLTEIMLLAVGLPVMRNGTVLTHAGGFSCEIDFSCTVLIPAALLGAVLLALPAARFRRWAGMAVALGVLALLNQLRLMSLVGLGVYAPAWYDLVHGWMWPALLALAVIGYGYLWHRLQLPAHAQRAKF